jgi:hypothetical protein
MSQRLSGTRINEIDRVHSRGGEESGVLLNRPPTADSVSACRRISQVQLESASCANRRLKDREQSGRGG